MWSGSLHTEQGKIADQVHSYLMANYKHFDKQWPDALKFYKRALALESPVFAHKGLIHFLHDTNNDQLIVQLKSVIETSFKDDMDIMFIYAQALANTQNEEAADKLLITLNQKDKKNQEIAFNTAQAYIRRKEPENAIKVIDALLDIAPRKPNHFIFHFMKAQIYLSLNKQKEALASLKTSLEIQPRFEKGWLLHALLEEKAGRLEEAIKGYTNFLDLAGPNQEIEQHMMGLAFKQKIMDKNVTTMSEPVDCFNHALRLFEEQKYKQSLAAIEQCIVQDSANLEAKMLKIQILTALNEIPEALATLKDWALQEPTHSLWYNTLHLLYRNGADIQLVIKTLHEIEKQQPDNLLPTLYLADLYLRTQSTHAATGYLKRALHATNDEKLQAALLFQLGALYYDHKQYKQLKELYRKYETAVQNNALFLNLMAYYYATKEKNLETSQLLVAKALNLDARNPHILDTQATIYYHQNEIDKALEIFEKIAEQEPNDDTIAKHLAHAYYRKGNLAKATSTLEHLITLTLDETKQKELQQLLLTWNQEQKK